MAYVTEYTCGDCGLELVDDGRVFVWDDNPERTEDFLILMNTYQKLHGAKITGNVSETYCRECGKYVKVYSITEVIDGIDDPCGAVMEGIHNYIDECGRELSRLNEIREKSEYSIVRQDNHYVVKIPDYEGFYYSNYLFPSMTREEVIEDALKDFHEEIDEVIAAREKRYRRYVDSHYLVIDERERPEDEFDIFEKVNCPECGLEISKHVDFKIPCPRCGGHIFGMGIHYD
jgi:predicted Zn-ribbon and HTH transcriptional regulator